MNNEVTNLPPRRKMSVLAEFSILSAGILVAVIALVIASVFVYIYLTQTPKKNVVIEDNAELLTQSEEREMKTLARDLSNDKDINVVIVTTDDKGVNYAQDDEGSESFAQDKYRQLSERTDFKDNSGVLLLIDMENRYVYIYTYGTAHAAVTNEECVVMTDSVVSDLGAERYAAAFQSLIGQIQNGDFFSLALVMVYVLLFLGPLVIVAIVLRIATHNKRSKITTDYSTYLDMTNTRDTGDKDVFDHKTVTVTTTSSGGGYGGGRSGGGGGGGGGRSGGGGSHF